MSSDILTARKGPVLEITLNRPEIGNAASDAMAVELTKLLLGAGESSEIVVLRGAGEDFCVGRETMGKRPPGAPPEAFELRRRNDVVFNCYGAFRRCEIPVIGVVRGRAIFPRLLPRSARSPRGTIRSGCAPAAKAAPPLPSPLGSTPSSTRSRNSASATWRCRSPRSGCGARCRGSRPCSNARARSVGSTGTAAARSVALPSQTPACRGLVTLRFAGSGRARSRLSRGLGWGLAS